jgi:hypothetical protein
VLIGLAGFAVATVAILVLLADREDELDPVGIGWHR